MSRSSSGIPALRASSRAVSIGQRTASPGNPSGRSPSLDKCPSLQVPALTLIEMLQNLRSRSPSSDPQTRPGMSKSGLPSVTSGQVVTRGEGGLQEWFQHPAYSTALDGPSGQTQPTPFEGVPKTRTWDENGANLAADMPSKPSFGFGTAIQEGSEHTNSDPEPGRPLISCATFCSLCMTILPLNAASLARYSIHSMEVEGDLFRREALKYPLIPFAYTSADDLNRFGFPNPTTSNI